MNFGVTKSWAGLAGLMLLSFACGSSSNSGGNGTSTVGGSGAAGTGTATGSGSAAGSGSTNTGSGTIGGSGTTAGGSGASTTGATMGSGATSGTSAAGSNAGSGTSASGTVGGAGTSSGAAGSGTTSLMPDGGSPGFSQACQTMTAGLIAKMTRAQKAAQMVMAGNGGVPIPTADVTSLAPGAGFAGGGSNPGDTGGTNTITDWANMTDAFYAAAAAAPNAIPPLFGLDAVHGMNGAVGTVIFPHNAGLASSRDAALVEQVEHVTAQECLAGGVTWAFGPFAGTTWDYRWGRIYESFSEDPTWAGEMLTAAVKGFQGDGGLGTGSPGMVACSKHWAGDGQTTAYTSHFGMGAIVDRGTSVIDLPTMEQWGIAPYLPALQAGLSCIMVSDSWWQIPGQPAPISSMTYSYQLLTTLLKGTYGFKGFVISDWNASNAAIAASVNAGVDMLMNPMDWKGAITAITTASTISDNRINDAVSRILNVKCQAGMWNYQRDPALLPQVGSAAHRMLGRQAVAQSLVLLQNTGSVLPLSPTAKVWVEGSGANDLGHQCGGWTIAWQGSGETTTGTTIKQAISKVVPLAASMQAADVDIVVLSEGPYAEWWGDRPSINTLPQQDFAYLSAAKAAGKKVVAIVVSGRPVLITNQLPSADAWIAAWLPGTEGDGVADVLFGMVKPTGKLSHSWPGQDAQPNVADAPVNIMCKSCGGAGSYKPLFPLGFGLTYP